MTENLPPYISIVFILTTFLTIGFLFHGIRQTAIRTIPAKILIGFISFWVFFTATAAIGGFYADTSAFPPRIFIFGVFPFLLLIVSFFIFFRKNFIEKLPLKTLVLLSIIRIPVEIVIYWLFQSGLMPEIMTFEGRNFDILSGISAPFIFWLAFRNDKINRFILLIWNTFALILLVNIVSTAVLAIPSSFQQIAFEQPNRAVLFFPFIWLPSIVVPIVLFSHLIIYWKLLFASEQPK